MTAGTNETIGARLDAKLVELRQLVEEAVTELAGAAAVVVADVNAAIDAVQTRLTDLGAALDDVGNTPEAGA